jgi:hypothetical protein
MRILFCCFVLGLCVAAVVPAVGQSDLPRVAGGVFGSAGGEGFLAVTATGGAYAEAARFRFRPGVEVRGTSGDLEGRLVLAGPRVSQRILGGDVYAAGLFGASHIPDSTGTKQISGVTTQVAIGMEKDLGPYVRWRVIELNAGFFSAASGVQEFSVSTGLVLHFH